MASETPAFSTCLSLHASGKLEAAEQCYRAILDNQPSHADSLHHLGIIALQTGHMIEAERLLRAARLYAPQNGTLLTNLAFTLLRLGRLEETIECCNEATRSASTPAEAFNIRGMAFAQLNRFAEALSSFENAVAVHPMLVDAHLNRGLALKSLGDTNGALKAFRRVLAIDQRSHKAYFNIGILHQSVSQFKEALTNYDRALSLNSPDDEVQANRCVTLLELGETSEALRSAFQLRTAHPENPRFEYLHALCLAQSLRYEEAIELFQRICASDPDNFEATYGMATAYSELGEASKALRYFDRALNLRPKSPEAIFAKSLIVLQAGDLDEGLVGFEARKLISGTMGIRSFTASTWDGVQDLKGRKILVHEEQGFGDTFLFCRFLLSLESKGAQITFAVSRRLQSVMSSLTPTLQLADPDPKGDFDFAISLLSVPFALRTTKSTIQKMGRYLTPTVAASERWRKRVHEIPHPRIGVVWRSNILNTAMTKRNIPFDIFSQIMRPEFSWVSLQVEADAERAFFSSHSHLYDFTADIADFDDTAAIIDHLDLLISVDTGVAHLAGALAKPTWLLLCKSADWRWFLGETKSPWYESVQLIRQSKFGDWHDVLAEVTAKLDLIAPNNHPS